MGPIRRAMGPWSYATLVPESARPPTLADVAESTQTLPERAPQLPASATELVSRRAIRYFVSAGCPWAVSGAARKARVRRATANLRKAHLPMAGMLRPGGSAGQSGSGAL